MSPLLKARPHAPLRARPFHSSVCTRNLVGPADPISNLRPVIYEDGSSSSSSSESSSSSSTTRSHPYSLKEFPGKVHDYHWQWKLQRQQLDAFDRSFWSSNNSRFEAAKAAVLDALPENSTPEDCEFVLSKFYRDWLIQETPRLTAYNAQWRKATFRTILLEAHSEYAKLLSSFGFRKS